MRMMKNLRKSESHATSATLQMLLSANSKAMPYRRKKRLVSVSLLIGNRSYDMNLVIFPAGNSCYFSEDSLVKLLQAIQELRNGEEAHLHIREAVDLAVTDACLSLTTLRISLENLLKNSRSSTISKDSSASSKGVKKNTRSSRSSTPRKKTPWTTSAPYKVGQIVQCHSTSKRSTKKQPASD